MLNSTDTQIIYFSKEDEKSVSLQAGCLIKMSCWNFVMVLSLIEKATAKLEEGMSIMTINLKYSTVFNNANWNTQN